MSKIKYQKFSSNDDFYLIRKHIKTIYDQATNHIRTSSRKLNILEIGPSDKIWFKGMETNWIKYNSKKIGHNYISFDVCGDVDYIGTIEKCPCFNDSEFDVILLISVLEHVRDIFSASKELCRITKPNGLIFIETPFLWRIHGPIPDYWRLSEYAYEYLFGENFKIDINTFPENELGKNSYPLSYNVVLRKK